eukprot:7744308-Pyramimonas_sp.AAC.1
MRRGPSAMEEEAPPKTRGSSSRRCLKTGAAILSGVEIRRSPVPQIPTLCPMAPAAAKATEWAMQIALGGTGMCT